MSQKNIDPAERVTIRQLRETGLSFHQIGRRVHRSLEYVRKACEGMPLPQKSINYKVGRYIGGNPGLSDEQIAINLGMSVEFIRERRHKMDPVKARKHDQQPTDVDKIDRGKRISPFDMRRLCGKGQRTIWQLQGMTNSLSKPFHLIELVRSAELAGLIVEKHSGLIHSPQTVESH